MFQILSLKGDPNWLLRILNSFWKTEQQSCSCGICLFSYCGLLENKAELSVVKFKKISLYPRTLKRPLHNPLILLGVGGNLAGKAGGRGVARGGMTDQGDIKGQVSTDTQLSKPDQLHFVGNLRPITAGSLKGKRKPQCWLVGEAFYRVVRGQAGPIAVYGVRGSISTSRHAKESPFLQVTPGSPALKIWSSNTPEDRRKALLLMKWNRQWASHRTAGEEYIHILSNIM